MLRKPFSLAIDATYSLDRSPSGVALYSREMLNGLTRAHPESRFAFCYRPHRFLRSFHEALPANARRIPLLGLAGGDLFHGLNQRLPKVIAGRSIATFHDLFVMTAEYSTPDFRARFTSQARDAAARADLIIAVSEFTKRQVVSLLGVDAARVRVVHHGIRSLAPQPDTPRENVILSAGAIQKRKNIGRLVEAFASVDPSWRLVLLGSSGYGSAEILAQIERSRARDRISVLGYVTPGELAQWYARASVFAFPSLDEGFGMPVLEAMAAGAPVLTSNRSAMPEVAGDAAILADPEDTSALAAGLAQLTNDANLRRELARKGRERAGQFTWEKAVQKTWDVYLELLRSSG